MSDVLSTETSTTKNSQVNSCSTGKFDVLPTLSIVTTDRQDPELVKMLQDDRIKVMERRNIALYNENTSLKNQLNQITRRAEELEQRNSINNGKISTEEILNNQKKNNQPEILQQPSWTICNLCRKKIQNNEINEPVVFITKTELESLEKDMQTLRDALATKEGAWDKIVEKEQNYCRQLTRLAQEVITVNQIAHNRQEDLQTLARTLEAKETKLRSMQKEVTGLKKIVVKQEKKHRGMEASNERQVANVQINERERRRINEIMQQLSTTKRGLKSNRSLQSSPRHGSN